MAQTTLLTIECFHQEKTHLRQRGEEKPARRISGGALAAVAANRNSPVLEIDLSYSKHWTIRFSSRDKNNLCRSHTLSPAICPSGRSSRFQSSPTTNHSTLITALLIGNEMRIEMPLIHSKQTSVVLSNRRKFRAPRGPQACPARLSQSIAVHEHLCRAGFTPAVNQPHSTHFL